MKDIEALISAFIDEQFPEFYQEDGSQFVAFVREYYKWMETTGGLGTARNLFNIGDIDATTDEFLSHYKNKYLNGVPLSTTTDTNLLVKNSKSIYGAKGNKRSVEILIRALYGEEVQIYRPGSDVFKTSDARWVKPTYLELSLSERSKDFVAQQVIGSLSSATAFVDRIVRKRVGTNYIDIAYLSNVKGTFQTGDIVTPASNTIAQGAPTVVGSMSSLDIITGGAEFKIGDTFTVVSSSGRQGRARVTSISNETGRVQFVVQDGGWGYSTTSRAIVSDRVLTLTGTTTPNSDVVFYRDFETIEQPLYRIEYDTLTTPTAVANDVVVSAVSGGLTVANGTIVFTTIDSDTEGSFVFAPNRSIAANINPSTDLSSSVITVTGHSFVNNMPVLYKTSFGNTAITGLANTTEYFVINTNTNDFQLASSVGGSALTITSTLDEGGHQIIASGNIVAANSVVTIGSDTAVITNDLDVTASGNTLSIAAGVPITGSLAKTKVGVFDVTNVFYPSLSAPISGVFTGTSSYITNISRGTGATFSVKTINYGEVVRTNPDLVSGYNSANVPFTEINLNGNNTGSALQFPSPITGSSGDQLYGSFGLDKFTGATIDTVILDALVFEDKTVGTIASIGSINPGIGYDTEPLVVVFEDGIAGFNRRDFIADISSATSNFAVGEIVYQEFNDNVVEIAVTGFSGLAANGDSLSTPVVTEYVYQDPGGGNTATGIIYTNGVAGGDGTLVLSNTTGTWTTSLPMQSTSSNGSASVATVTETTNQITAQGIIKAGSNTSTILIKRITFANLFRPGQTIYGRTTGAEATLDVIAEDNRVFPIGLNADVNVDVQVANAAVTNVDVLDSGFGYIDGETVTLISSDSDYELTALVNVDTQGTGEGFYLNNVGFPSSVSKLHDNDYYQDYSYEVQTKIPFVKYADILKQVVHIAGTKPFGKVVALSYASVSTSMIDTVPILSFAGAYTGIDGTVYTGAYTGTYTQAFTKAYTGAFTGTFAGTLQYSSLYTLSFTGTYTQQYTTAFTPAYTNTYNATRDVGYTSAYGASYTGAYTKVFVGGYTGTYTSNSGPVFTSVYGSFTSVYTSDKAYTKIYSQQYTAVYATPVYTTVFGSYTAEYTSPFPVYSSAYIGTTAYTTVFGSYTTEYTGSDAYTSGYVGTVPVEGYTQAYTLVYTTGYNITYSTPTVYSIPLPLTYTSAYTLSSFTGMPAFTGLFNAVYGSYTSSYSSLFTGETFTGAFSGTAYTVQYTGADVFYVDQTFTNEAEGVTYTGTSDGQGYTNADIFNDSFVDSYTTAFTLDMGAQEYVNVYSEVYNKLEYTTSYSTSYTLDSEYTAVFGTYTTIYTSATEYTTSYSMVFTRPETADDTLGRYTETYTPTYTTAYTGTSYTTEYTGTVEKDASVYVGYTGFTSEFTALYSAVYGSYTTEYTSVYTSDYTGAASYTDLLTYTTAYTIDVNFTGQYTSATGVYTLVYTTVYTDASYSTAFTDSTATEYTGSYTLNTFTTVYSGYTAVYTQDNIGYAPSAPPVYMGITPGL